MGHYDESIFLNKEEKASCMQQCDANEYMQEARIYKSARKNAFDVCQDLYKPTEDVIDYDPCVF